MAEGERESPFPEYRSVCKDPDPECKDYIMNQTMLRIKDPKVSLDFYANILGMR